MRKRMRKKIYECEYVSWMVNVDEVKGMKIKAIRLIISLKCGITEYHEVDIGAVR